MTANQRRPGFRLPWSSDHEEAEPASEPTSDASAPTVTTESAPADAPVPAEPGSAGTTEALAAATDTNAPATEPAAGTMATGEPIAAAQPATSGVPAPTNGAGPVAGAGEAPEAFLRDLVDAMRGVAEEARDAGLADLRAQADAAVKQLEEVAERRRGELRERAETDVAAVGEWATAEADRIRREAESRVAARRSQLEEQLAAETRRSEAEAKALRERVAEYERELEAYHRQLNDIHDPAAFAAAAKRMPKPPALTVTAAPPVARTESTAPPVEPTAAAPAEPATPAAPTVAEPATNGTSTTPTAETTEIHPAEEEVLAGRLAELDAELEPATAAPAEPTSATESGEPMTTDVVVKGLGSFGAITGFRQSLAGVSGIDGVALSLGSSGEFIFRTTHRPSVDVAAAISGLEGDGAKVERRADGTLAVTLDRAR